MKGCGVMSNWTRREFIKTASMAALAMVVPVDVFAATEADLVVYGKIFTSEKNKIGETACSMCGDYCAVKIVGKYFDSPVFPCND